MLPNHRWWYAKWEEIHIAHTFSARLAPICKLSKISASELSQKFIKKALLVGYHSCWLWVSGNYLHYVAITKLAFIFLFFHLLVCSVHSELNWASRTTVFFFPFTIQEKRKPCGLKVYKHLWLVFFWWWQRTSQVRELLSPWISTYLVVLHTRVCQ